MAPGWEPQEGGSIGNNLEKRRSGILEPSKKKTDATSMAATIEQPPTNDPQAAERPRDAMEDLVEGLARLDQQGSH